MDTTVLNHDDEAKKIKGNLDFDHLLQLVTENEDIELMNEQITDLVESNQKVNRIFDETDLLE